MSQTKLRQIQLANDGWTEAGETWTYYSPTEITVPSGANSKYQKGDKICLTQTTLKYFNIIGVADTLLTITGGTDYTLANVTIVNPKYSKLYNPQGFPTTFSYTATWSGSGSMTISSWGGTNEKFWIVGNVCYFAYYNTGGTTAGTADLAITATLPITPAITAENGCMIRDGTTTNYVPGWMEMSTDGKAYFYKNTYVNWGIGTGRHAKGQGCYIY